MDDEDLIPEFGDALLQIANRLGGISVLAAAAACEATFGPVERMTLWQRREVNRLLASYGLSLDFPNPGPLKGA